MGDLAMTSGATTENDTAQSNVPQGLFIYNKEQEINERLISAVGDLGEPNRIAFGDFDNDSDEDIAYSFGGDLYFKENFTKNPKRHFVTDDPGVVSLDSLLPAAGAVNGFLAPSVNNRLASLKWDATDSQDILGYEIISKASVDAFDRSGATATHRVHLIPDDSANDSANPEMTSATSGVAFEVLSGEIELASGKISTDLGDSGAVGVLAPGDGIATGNNSEAKLTFSDGSTIMMDEKTFLFAPDVTRDTVISVVQGEAQIAAAGADTVAADSSAGASAVSNSALLRPGTIIKVGDAEVSVTMSDGTVIDLPSFIEFTVPDFQKIKATVSEVEGAVTLNTAPRVLFEKGDEFAVDNALLVHTRRETRLTFRYGEGEYSFLLPQDAVFSLSRFAPGTTIKVKKGSLETIQLGAAQKSQQAEDDMLILPSDTLFTGPSGSAIIRYSDAAEFPLGKYETFLFDTLSYPADPSYELRMENGNYISKIFTLLPSGQRSTESASILLAPQVCADHSPPSANAGKSEQQVLLYQTLTLDARSSFDTHSNIIRYSWDITPEDDSDSASDTHDTTLKIGPFTQASSSEVKLTVEDERGNTASATITIDVTVPSIFLDPSSGQSGQIQGYIDSKIADIPLNILRERGGVWEFLETPRAPDGIILTDEEGKFIIPDVTLSSHLSVETDQTTVAEISPVSGRIQPSEDGYTVSVKSAESGEPTRLELHNSQSSVSATVFFVPDKSIDVAREPSDFIFTKESVADFSGVHVRELARGVFTNDLQTTKKAVAFRIDSDGTISLFQDSLSLKLAKSADLDDPAVIQIVSGDTPLAEVYIATPPQGQYSFLTEEDARDSTTLYTLEEGLYVVAPSCDACPCQAKIVDRADIIPGDVIFAAIMDPERNEIYAKSEEIVILRE